MTVTVTVTVSQSPNENMVYFSKKLKLDGVKRRPKFGKSATEGKQIQLNLMHVANEIYCLRRDGITIIS
jgi:hypothetical protein